MIKDSLDKEIKFEGQLPEAYWLTYLTATLWVISKYWVHFWTNTQRKCSYLSSYEVNSTSTMMAFVLNNKLTKFDRQLKKELEIT